MKRATVALRRDTTRDLLGRLTGDARERLREIDAAQVPAECEGTGEARWRRLAAVAMTIAALVIGPYAAHGQAPSLAARGQSVFTLNGCYGCHVVGKAGTPIGPELSYVGAKYSQPYLVRWLRDPAEQRPSAHMPALELTDDDVRALAAYLSTLR